MFLRWLTDFPARQRAWCQCSQVLYMYAQSACLTVAGLMARSGDKATEQLVLQTYDQHANHLWAACMMLEQHVRG